MSDNTAKGRIKFIYDRRTLAENFYVQEFVVTIGEETPYPQHVTFKCLNDNCHQLIELNEGDIVEMFFVLRGRYGKRPANGGNHLPFNSLEVYRIYKDDAI